MKIIPLPEKLTRNKRLDLYVAFFLTTLKPVRCTIKLTDSKDEGGRVRPDSPKQRLHAKTKDTFRMN